jgi:hypothetical protein
MLCTVTDALKILNYGKMHKLLNVSAQTRRKANVGA